MFAGWLPARNVAIPQIALAAGTLAASTIAIAFLRATIHVTYPAPVYLLAVLAVGTRFGTIPAALTSVAAFLLYDFLFVEPLYTLTINSPDEWLNLLLLLAVSVVIGRLAAHLAARAAEAAARAREAESLHAVTSVLAATRTVAEAAPAVASSLRAVTSMSRVWVGLGGDPSSERILADTSDEPSPVPGWQVVLQRSADGQMRWVKAHLPGRRPQRTVLHRVRIEVAGQTFGSVWALRSPDEPEPDRSETRILSAAADQLGQAIVRDRLAHEATAAEIARESEALKTALLDSVSHDLRTPLATIRAAAGSMLDSTVSWTDQDRREAFEAIDSEAERMGRLVRNLLDLSRIEGGALKPELEIRDLGELAREAVARVNPAGKSVSVSVGEATPAVMVDEVFLSQVLTNLLENAVRYGGQMIEVRVRREDGSVVLSVEDDGEGVPPAALPRLFEKFYQVPRVQRQGRRGMGIGLTVVAGLAGAMCGSVTAWRSDLGGLAIGVTFDTVELPAEQEVGVR